MGLSMAQRLVKGRQASGGAGGGGSHSCGKAGCKGADPKERPQPHQKTLWNIKSSSGLSRVWKRGECQGKGTGRQHTLGFPSNTPNALAILKYKKEPFGSWVGLASHQRTCGSCRGNPGHRLGRAQRGLSCPGLTPLSFSQSPCKPGLRSQTQPFTKPSLPCETSQEGCCLHFPDAETEAQGGKQLYTRQTVRKQQS